MATSYKKPAFEVTSMIVNSFRSIEDWQSETKYVTISVAVYKSHDFIL